MYGDVGLKLVCFSILIFTDGLRLADISSALGPTRQKNTSSESSTTVPTGAGSCSGA